MRTCIRLLPAIAISIAASAAPARGAETCDRIETVRVEWKSPAWPSHGWLTLNRLPLSMGACDTISVNMETGRIIAWLDRNSDHAAIRCRNEAMGLAEMRELFIREDLLPVLRAAEAEISGRCGAAAPPSTPPTVPKEK